MRTRTQYRRALGRITAARRSLAAYRLPLPYYVSDHWNHDAQREEGSYQRRQRDYREDVRRGMLA
jgi:hypothetical protein